MEAASAAGHRLRDMKFPEPSEIIEHDVVIAGGGIAGLSAARWLKMNGRRDVVLLELAENEGGNSAWGANEVSEYPWGAHYLPVPDPALRELMDFLEQAGIVKEYNEQGLPVFNEFYLCHDPEERLFIHGRWQEGLIPQMGVPEADRKEIERFLALMNAMKAEKGKDGKNAFAIPVDHSSTDEEFTSLDKITMKEYMKQHGFASPYLYWYVDYGCRDDYGTPCDQTSAWAGIHYFASRRGAAANADPNTVLTWPEGNGFLVKHLRSGIASMIRSNCIVFRVETKGEKTRVDYFDLKAGISKRIIANKCIVATPQFITGRIVNSSVDRSSFTYSPWMVANITVKDLPERPGFPLCWDNVFYDSSSVGYVNSTHQHINRQLQKQVLTYYLPLTANDPRTERMQAYNRTHNDWTKMILDDLYRPHTGIEQVIENIDVWVWGHAMIRPVPGLIWSEARAEAARPHEGKIFFAHSDLGGISIFEEAFYQGIRAAREVLNASRFETGENSRK